MAARDISPFALHKPVTDRPPVVLDSPWANADVADPAELLADLPDAPSQEPTNGSQDGAGAAPVADSTDDGATPVATPDSAPAPTTGKA